MKNTIALFSIVFFMLLSCTSVEREWNKTTKKNTVIGYKRFISNYPQSNYYKQAYERISVLRNDSIKAYVFPNLNKLKIKGKWTTIMIKGEVYDGVRSFFTSNYIETEDKMYAIHMNPNSKLIGIEHHDNSIVMEYGNEINYYLYGEVVDFSTKIPDKEIISRLKVINNECVELLKSLNSREKRFIQSDSLNSLPKYKELFSTNKFDTLFSISCLSQEYKVLNNYLSCIQCSNYSIGDKKIVPVLVDSIVRIN